MDQPANSTTNLAWTNVGLGFIFILFDAVVSRALGLGVGLPLVTAAVRCVIQFGLMALVLQKIFEAGNPWGVAGLTVLLNLLGTLEIIVNKAKMRFVNMFPLVFLCMLFSSLPVTILGAIFAMPIKPIWKPAQFIPLVALGSSSGIRFLEWLSLLTMCSKKYMIIETRLRRILRLVLPVGRHVSQWQRSLFGCQALTPHINQMSVLGIIAIPGTMTGALLGGAPVDQAARLQMVIMFMICAASALAAILVTVTVSATIVDSEHRIRTERVDTRKHWVWRAREGVWVWCVEKVKSIAGRIRSREEGSELVR